MLENDPQGCAGDIQIRRDVGELSPRMCWRCSDTTGCWRTIPKDVLEMFRYDGMLENDTQGCAGDVQIRRDVGERSPRMCWRCSDKTGCWRTTPKDVLEMFR